MTGRDIEGIVFHHPDGRMAKIKLRDFGLKRGDRQAGIKMAEERQRNLIKDCVREVLNERDEAKIKSERAFLMSVGRAPDDPLGKSVAD